MREQRLILVAAGSAALLLGAVAGGGVPAHLVAMAVIALVASYLAGRRLRSGEDDWLPKLMLVAMFAKLIGSWARHAVLFSVYGGTGDAVAYHSRGLIVADTWRNLAVPDMATVGGGSQGTQFVGWLTGLLYAPFEPSSLGGFWIFAQLAFIGQIFVYLAFRRVAPRHTWKPFAILMFFWPTLLYWPSSIGKEAILLLFVGVAAWAAAGLYQQYHLRWLPILGGAVALTGVVRVHVAALMAGSVVAASVLARKPKSTTALVRLGILLAAGAIAAVPITAQISEEFGIDLASSVNSEELDPIIADIERRTGQGGSAVNGEAIRSPADIPEAAIRVLFRPLPNEASNAQTLAASLEGLLLLGLVVWRAPQMIKGVGLMRRSPFLMFCLVYTAGFVWGWSVILNYGILARQRSLLVPFVLVLVAALGWRQVMEQRRPPDDPPRDRTLAGASSGSQGPA